MSKIEALNHQLSNEEQYQIRVEKIQKMASAGYAAWPESLPVTTTTAQILHEFVEEQAPEYQVAGRVISLRWHGKTAFITIQDRSGRLQVYLREDTVGNQKFSDLVEFLDLGDFLWVDGTPFKTKTGEITLRAKQAELISKCLHPLPEKFHGLTDVETRYRQRYLDLISNPEAKERFLKRSKIVSSIRHFLEDLDFIEVETPMLHPIPGGALAKPFVTHHNALGDDFYLRIAPELYLKRLVIGGIERVFEINRNFRNEGVSTRHNPEFTMLEFYMAYKDYRYGMDLVEELLRTVSQSVCGTTLLTYGDHQIDFGARFERVSVHDALLKYGGFGAEDLDAKQIDQTLSRCGIQQAGQAETLQHKLYLLFEETTEVKLVQPTFLIDFPIEVSPLSKRDVRNPELAARFELFIGGMELANAFNELNDPFDQADRFQIQAAGHSKGNDESHHYDADYIKALEYGLPPTLGVGIGIDRLSMILTDTTSIRDVILFPTLKKK